MPRPRTNPLFELGDQWIAEERGTQNYYRFWNDAGTGRTRRASLGTSDLEAAKRKLAELVVNDVPKTVDASLSVVLEDYFVKHTDHLASRSQTRNGGKVLLRFFGPTCRVSAITTSRQREFAIASLAKGQKLSYIARNMVVLHAALAHAKIPHEVIYTVSQMERQWGLKAGETKKARVPTDLEFAKLWSTAMPDTLRRFILIQMGTGGRPQTAVDLTSDQWRQDAGIVYLKAVGKPQNKKYRAAVRAPKVLEGWLEKWGEDPSALQVRGGRYCGYNTMEGPETALKTATRRAGIPRITTYSFRQKVTTILRLADVSEDEIATLLGHKRPNVRITGEYGEWAPSYLAKAATALDAWFLKVQALTEKPLFSQGIPKSLRGGRKKAA